MTKIGNAYRWIYGRMLNRPTNFSWVIEDKLAGSGMPMNYSQFLWVTTHGVKAIVTVREVPLPSKWFSNGNSDDDVDYFHLRVEDYGAPSIEEMIIQLIISNNKYPIKNQLWFIVRQVEEELELY
jgi:atypical dual specificity phosphatase